MRQRGRAPERLASSLLDAAPRRRALTDSGNLTTGSESKPPLRCFHRAHRQCGSAGCASSSAFVRSLHRNRQVPHRYRYRVHTERQDVCSPAVILSLLPFLCLNHVASRTISQHGDSSDSPGETAHLSISRVARRPSKPLMRPRLLPRPWPTSWTAASTSVSSIPMRPVGQAAHTDISDRAINTEKFEDTAIASKLTCIIPNQPARREGNPADDRTAGRVHLRRTSIRRVFGDRRLRRQGNGSCRRLDMRSSDSSDPG